MNCPKCDASEVTPVGATMLCEKCQHSFASADTPKPPADPYAPRLVRCPTCSHQVSSLAASCPSCGQPLEPQVNQEKVQAEKTKARNKIRNGFALLALAYWVYVWIRHVVNTPPSN